MKKVSKKEIEYAKYAAVGFISEVFIEKRIGGVECQKFYHAMSNFATLQPSPGARKAGQGYIDYYAPSFWHACCAILYRWAISRFQDLDKKADIHVYRGQTNPWPICPTIWRSGFSDLESCSIEAVRKYLIGNSDEIDDPSIDFFPGFLSLNGITAFAQHHEFPTRFIDFSFHPLVALYFASMPGTKAEIPGNKMEGHGIIFQSRFSNLEILAKKTDLKIDLELSPPEHVPRLYQQQGFFIDCGSISSRHHLEELECAFERVYFARSYPEIEGADMIFSEHIMMIALGNETDPFTSGHLANAERSWYVAFYFYVEAIEALKKYARENVSSFDVGEASAMMKASNAHGRPPWGDFGASNGMRGIEAAGHLARAALQICNIARIYSRTQYLLDESVVLAYARQNRALFAAILEISKKIELFGIEEYAEEISSVKGVIQEIAGSLSEKQKGMLDDFTEACYA